MEKQFPDILVQQTFGRNDLIRLISAGGSDQTLLHARSCQVAEAVVGKKVFFRGLVEFSNICTKDCFYCGIRKSNHEVERYTLDDDAIVDAARLAWKNRYGSLVLQSGERSDAAFVDRIGGLLMKIKTMTGGELGVTLSLGEQTEETYRYWYECGAHRYLLRIESSSEALYHHIHPNDADHGFANRLRCLYDLKRIGYQTGTGVMIGLPFQDYGHLADDLLFMERLDVDMVGMGPYIEHAHTPLYGHRHRLWPVVRRFGVALNMVAALRLMMPDINIAATTALQAIDPIGREKALKIGANVIMPNITPSFHRKDYLLYENKPCTDEGTDDCAGCAAIRIEMAGKQVALGEWGDSAHYFNRKKSS
ncbi:MAG: [FeFe] hydrogenase H-cluster radical SAM maturase HydE [Breznakibacter sp.]